MGEVHLIISSSIAFQTKDIRAHLLCMLLDVPGIHKGFGFFNIVHTPPGNTVEANQSLHFLHSHNAQHTEGSGQRLGSKTSPCDGVSVRNLKRIPAPHSAPGYKSHQCYDGALILQNIVIYSPSSTQDLDTFGLHDSLYFN